MIRPHLYLFHNNASQKLAQKGKKKNGQEIVESFNYKLILSQKWCFYLGIKGNILFLKRVSVATPKMG